MHSQPFLIEEERQGQGESRSSEAQTLQGVRRGRLQQEDVERQVHDSGLPVTLAIMRDLFFPHWR
jgi:hypothetical protein